MRFKVGELAGVAYMRSGNPAPASVSIYRVGPFSAGASCDIPEWTVPIGWPADYFCVGCDGKVYALLDCQLIKLSDPDRAEELMEELENAIP